MSNPNFLLEADDLVMKKKILSVRENYDFELGTMRKNIVKLIGEEYWVEKNGVEFMRIYGDFTEHGYRMEVNGVPVASVHKKWGDFTR